MALAVGLNVDDATAKKKADIPRIGTEKVFSVAQRRGGRVSGAIPIESNGTKDFLTRESRGSSYKCVDKRGGASDTERIINGD